MYRVLIADDEFIERAVVSKFINSSFEGRLETVEAVNGREATEKFFDENCDIALLDIEMPGVNGLEAAEQIREKNKNCIIIFLTAFDEFAYAKRAIGVRAMEYMLKPAPKEELEAVLEEAIRVLDSRKEEGLLHDGIARSEATADGEVDMAGSTKLNAICETIKNYIDGNYMNDISLQNVASILNYSDAYFCKIFKQCFGKGFVLYLSEYRIDKAKELMEDLSINIKDIGDRVGYKDPNYFTKVFKRKMEMTPSEYRLMVMKQKEQ